MDLNKLNDLWFQNSFGKSLDPDVKLQKELNDNPDTRLVLFWNELEINKISNDDLIEDNFTSVPIFISSKDPENETWNEDIFENRDLSKTSVNEIHRNQITDFHPISDLHYKEINEVENSLSYQTKWLEKERKIFRIVKQK